MASSGIGSEYDNSKTWMKTVSPFVLPQHAYGRTSTISTSIIFSCVFRITTLRLIGAEPRLRGRRPLQPRVIQRHRPELRHRLLREHRIPVRRLLRSAVFPPERY